LRQATIGGDRIAGGVMLDKKPLKFALVRLYSSSGKTVWIGTTDENGRFAINKMPPGDYHLKVSGWGSTIVHLNPGIDRAGDQVGIWNLFLEDNACISWQATYN
jgi:hypothetical protein